MPRQQHHINGEMDAVKRMCDFLERKEFGLGEIYEYLDSPYCKEDKAKREFLRKITEVRDGMKIVFDDYYLNEVLGGVADHNKNTADLFNSVGDFQSRKDS